MMFCEPLGLEMVAGVLAPAHDVRILDLMVEPAAFTKTCRAFQPEVVGLTSLCIDVEAVKTLARHAKALLPGVITLAGGTQAFLNPAAFHDESIDHVFHYTTRENLLALFASLAQGEAVPCIDGIQSRAQGYRSTGVAGRNAYLLPDRAATARYRPYYSYLGYRPCAILQTSLGCRNHCDFCLRWRIEGAEEQEIDLDVVMGQIAAITEPSIMIFDNDFLHCGERLLAFCDALETHGIRKTFLCYASVRSILAQQELLPRLAQNGIRAMLVGYESFKPEELAAYRKATTVEDSLAASRLLKMHGIDCWASFILHPDWDARDFAAFRRFIGALAPEISTCCPLTPFPNLPMFIHYSDRLLVPVDHYQAWSFGKVTIRPSRLSLRRYYWEMLKTVFYINFRMNSAAYMVQRFGAGTVLRLTAGSLRVLHAYLRLMLTAPSETQPRITTSHT
jgi:radical SAM superfamily enzyme YgiQ (UPF0313 family)